MMYAVGRLEPGPFRVVSINETSISTTPNNMCTTSHSRKQRAIKAGITLRPLKSCLVVAIQTSEHSDTVCQSEIQIKFYSNQIQSVSEEEESSLADEYFS